MTFSLLGRCAETGQFGAVVTSSSTCVGARVPFLTSKVGAILTQHRTDPRLGPRGLDLLASGCSAEETLAALVASTPDHGWRQLAAIDASGATAAFSGVANKPLVAEARGKDCVAIGNILASSEVPQAMVDAFVSSAGASLAERLMLALEAGEAAGGEGRVLRAAALKVVDEEIFPLVDLRVDASDTPIPALRALWLEYAPQIQAYVDRALRPNTM